MERSVIIVVMVVGLLITASIYYVIDRFTALDYFVCLILAGASLLVYKGKRNKNKRPKDDDARRFFQVIDKQSGRKCIIKFEHYSDLEQKCREKFDYSPEMKIILELEDNNAELDGPSLECFDNNTTIMIRIDKAKDETVYRKETDVKRELEDGNADVDEYGFHVVGNNEIPRIRESSAKTTWTWSTPVENITSGVQYVRQTLKTKGKDKLKDILEEADDIAVQPLSIAVIGSSGQGKSKLINTLRNLHYGDEGYAGVGVIETTMECTPYYHPFYQNIVFWDVPGVGTERFPKEDYASKIKFDRYDFFLVCSATRFTTDDKWLLGEIKQRKKKCYFLRTKVDIDIESSRREKGNEFNLKEQLQEIRNYCQRNIPINHKMFLISSCHPTEYDFQSLFATLLGDAPQEQRRSLALGLIAVSVEMIEEKAEYLKNEIWKSATLSAIGGVVFIPGFSFGLDMALIYKKLNEYQRHFELTDADIKRYASMVHLPVDVFRQQAGLKLNFNLITSQGLNYLVKGIGLQMATEEAARFVPVIGVAIASAIPCDTMAVHHGCVRNGCSGGCEYPRGPGISRPCSCQYT